MKKMSKFLSYYKPYKWVFLADMLCAIIASGVNLLFPLIIRHITSDVLSETSQNVTIYILQIAVLMLFLTFVEYLCNYFITSYGHIMGSKIENDMRNELFEHLQKLPLSYYDNQQTGTLMSNITNSLFDITELAHHGPEDLLISATKLIGAFFILLSINVKMTLLLFAFIPVMIVFAAYYNLRMRKAFRKSRDRIDDINAGIEDSLSGIRVVKSFANEDVELHKFRKNSWSYVLSKGNIYRILGRYHSGINAFGSILQIVVIISAAFLIAGGEVNTVDLITFVLYLSMFLEPIKKLVNFAEMLQNGASGFDKFYEILNVNPDIFDKPDAIDVDSIRGDISFKNVSFRYSDDTEKVFSDINLEIEAGEYIALVGASGVGKSTMCNLIPRFYEASSGSVLIDGIDIRDIKLHSLRKNIGIVQQDVYLFAGTVLENIRYGKPGATDEEIIEASKRAFAHEFVMTLPDGYDTDIGQN
ncbi:MAG: ABC transporter ATP-binding protein, partial [Clostridiales bacterium]|nr:ABC transporter ATP-binding protein [Clostridiales bacterium]